MKITIYPLFSTFLLGAITSILGLLPIASHAATLASNGSQSDVAVKIASAVDGDVVTIPAGTFSWTSGVSFSGKGITIRGAGGGWVKGSSTTSNTIASSGNKTFTVAAGLGFETNETITAVQKSDGAVNYMTGTVASYSGTTLVIALTSSGGSGTYTQWNFRQAGSTIIVNNAGTAVLFMITEDTTTACHVQNIHFKRGTSSGEHIIINGGGKPCTISDCRFEEAVSTFAIELRSPHGIINSCYFDTGFNWPRNGAYTGMNTTQFIRMPTVSQTSWTVTTPYGALDVNGDQNLYIEDCFFHGAFTEAIDFDGGMRVVFRYNVIDNCGLTSHGADTGNYGLRWFECYNNIFIYDNMSATQRSAPMSYFFYMRGGSGLFTDNVIPDLNSTDYGDKAEISLTVQNLQRNGGPYPLWGDNIAGIQYPAPRQVGMGRVTGTGTSGSVGYNGDPEPVYQWNNTGGGNYASPAILNYSTPAGSQDNITGYIQVGRDWLNQPKPNYTKYTYPHPLRIAPFGVSSPPKNATVAIYIL